MPGLELQRKKQQNEIIREQRTEKQAEIQRREYLEADRRFAEARRLSEKAPEYISRYFYEKQETIVTRQMPTDTDIKRRIKKEVEPEYQDGSMKKSDYMTKIVNAAAALPQR